MVTMVMMVPMAEMVVAMGMAIAQARELTLMPWADNRPTWGLLSSLSEPHDQPYPTQPYATKPSQFHSLTNCNTTPYKFPMVCARGQRHGKGNAMSGPPYDGATVRRTTYDRYDVQRTTGTTYNVRQYDKVTHAE